MARRSAWLSFAALALFGVASCAVGSQVDDGVDNDSDLKADGPSHHIAGEPTSGTDIFQWVAVGDDALEKYRNTIFPPPRRGRVLAADDARTLHYQAYVERIDAWIREKRPDLVVHTPIPRIRIYQDAFENAWASGVPVCIDAPVTFDGIEPASQGREYYTAVLHHSYVEPMEEYTGRGGFFGEPSRRTEDCVEASHSGMVQEFVQWINARNGPCRYELRDGRIHVSGPACRLDRRFSDFAGAKSARYHAVIPVIFVTTAFLDFIQDEAQIASVIAHELAHYYKSHATNADFVLTGDIFEGVGEEDYSPSRQGYNYFYSQTLEPSPTRPLPRPDSDDIRRRVLRFGPNQVNAFKHIEAATLDPTLGRFVVSLVYGPDLPRNTVPSCQQAYDLVMDNQFFNLIHGAQLSSDEQQAYLQLERSFLECARSVRVPQDLENGRVVSAFSTVMRQELPDFEMDGTLEEVVLALDRLMRSYSAAEREFYDFMTGEHIGYYTAEQEADELGAELLAAIGIDPIAQALLDLRGGDRREAEAPEGFRRVNGVTMQRCRELFDNHWIDPESGEYAFVPIGSLTDTHHGPCYRAFNTSREIVAHGYAAAGPPPSR